MVNKEIKKKNIFNEFTIHTGQHYDKNMSQIFFDQLSMEDPKYNLDINDLPYGNMIGRQTEEIEKILLDESPDTVIVYGDTNSTLSGALAACNLSLRLAHVESGLRSYNRLMPEEINRIITDHLADLLFTPTSQSQKNLVNEGIDNSKVFFVGDTMLDAYNFFIKNGKFKSNIINELNVSESNYLLCTIHRRENINSIERMILLIEILAAIPQKVIFVIHPNTKKKINNYKLKFSKNVKTIDPLGYFDMMFLLTSSLGILTDSGGVQKEACFVKKPCFVFRNETEWVELINSQNNYLISGKEDFLKYFKKMDEIKNKQEIFGDGHASKKIIQIIGDFHG